MCAAATAAAERRSGNEKLIDFVLVTNYLFIYSRFTTPNVGGSHTATLFRIHAPHYSHEFCLWAVVTVTAILRENCRARMTGNTQQSIAPNDQTTTCAIASFNCCRLVEKSTTIDCLRCGFFATSSSSHSLPQYEKAMSCHIEIPNRSRHNCGWMDLVNYLFPVIFSNRLFANANLNVCRVINLFVVVVDVERGDVVVALHTSQQWRWFFDRVAEGEDEIEIVGWHVDVISGRHTHIERDKGRGKSFLLLSTANI